MLLSILSSSSKFFQYFKLIINFYKIFLFPLWILKNIHHFLFSYLFPVFTLNFTLQFIFSKLWSGPLRSLMSVIALLNLLLMKIWSVWFTVLPSAEYHVSLWISLCGNVVLLTFKPLDITNWIIFILVLLVVLCKLSLPVVGLYMLSLPNFALKSPCIILMSNLAIWFIFCSNKL